MRYLNDDNVDGLPPAACSGDKSQCLVEHAESSPLWLPSGWIVKTITRKSGAEAGRKHRYYISPVSGFKFRSKVEVMRFLNVEKAGDPSPVLTACSENNSQSLVEHVENSPLWLPSGWIVETRTRKSGVRAGSKYKYYISPVSGNKLRSRAEVMRFLNVEKASSPPTVSAACLENNSQCYYTDPVSGYVFRSKKDVYRFIETGEISKRASRPRKKTSTNDIYSIKVESLLPISVKKLEGQGTTARRCLFAGQIPNSNQETAKENGKMLVEEPWLSPTEYASLQCEEVAGPRCLVLSDSAYLKQKQVKTTQVEEQTNPNFNVDGVPERPLELSEEQALDQVIGKLLDSVSEKLPGPLNEKLLELGDREILELGEEKSPQSCEPVGVNSLIDKQLCFDVMKPQVAPELKLLGPEEPLHNKLLKPLELADKMPSETPDKNLLKLAEMNSMESQHKVPYIPANMTLAKPANENMLNPEERIANQKLLEPQEKLPKMVNEKIRKLETKKPDEFDGEHGTLSTWLRRSKSKTKRLASLPCRASKRLLAGLEVDPAAEIEVGDWSLRRGQQAGRQETSPPNTLFGENFEGVIMVTPPPLSSEKPEREQAALERAGTGENTDGKPKTTIMSPFGNSWPDPCIEFAFKTLTGEIPVMVEDTVTVQDCFHQQLSSVQTTSPGRSSTSSCCSPDVLAIQVQLEPAERQHSLPGNDEQVNKNCRRSMTGRLTWTGETV